MIRAVIFDLGHTLWDISPVDNGALGRAYAAMRATLCARLGRDDLPGADVLRGAVSDALRADRETYFELGQVLEQPPTHSWVGRACRAVGLDLDDDVLAEITPPLFATEVDRLICSPGTADALHALAADGFALGCVTNTLADTATIHRMLEIHGLHAVMKTVVVSSAEGWRKPHPSLFEKALAALSAGPEQALFVGDSPYHDIGGAKACGMRAILTRQYVTRPHVDGCPQPDATIAHVRELPDVIGRLNASQQSSMP
jgi:HAD superfamily hydrolase (TIGR01662 family)